MSRIVIIGAGNVATHLGQALKDSGNEIIQVYSRTEQSARTLAKKLETVFTTSMIEINKNADIYLLSVSDDAITNILKELSTGNKLLVHTSGFSSMDILSGKSKNCGVFYLLQTFSKSRSVDMKTVPLCIEANSDENYEILKSLANQVSDDVHEVSSEQRRKLHLAAVFACNFPNFMYSVADQLLGDSKIDFDILKPLIKETAEKVQDIKPAEAQTGPAKRGDNSIMDAHLEMLVNYSDFKQIYQLISKEIQRTNNQEPTTENQEPRTKINLTNNEKL